MVPVTMVDGQGRVGTRQVAGGASDAEIRVAVLPGAAALRSEEGEWRRLAADAHLLIQHEWLETWHKAFATRADFFILKASRGDATVGYLPLVRYRTRWRRLPVTMLSLCANEHSTWGSLLLSTDRSSAVAQAFGDFLLQWRGWDVMQLPRLPLLSTRSRHLLDSLLAADAGVVSRLEYQYVLRLPDVWDDYLRSLSRNFRDNLGSTRRRLGKLGAWTITITTSADETLAAFASLVSVDDRSWKKRSGETIASRPNANAFYEGLVEAFAPQGRCWIALLELNGTVISAALFFEQDGVAYGLKSSSDVEVEAGSVSAGHVTLMSGVEEAHRRGLRTIQLLSGAPTWERYKGDLEPVLSAHAYNRHFYGRLVEFADRVAAGLVKKPPMYAVPADRRRPQEASPSVGKRQG